MRDKDPPPPGAPPHSTGGLSLDVPDLDVPVRRASTSSLAAVRPSGSLAAVRPSGSPAAIPSQAPAAIPSGAPSHGIAIDTSEDDFDMHIDRDFAASMPPSHYSPSTRPGSTASVPPRSSQSVARSGAPSGSGLEIAYRRTSARPAVEESDDPSTGMRIGAWLVSSIAAGGAAAGLVRVAHKVAGLSVTAPFPHAFDGSSTVASGATSLVSLAVAIAIGGIGLKLRPRSWAYVSAGGTLLLSALAMVTVTLASSGENSAPPDGALLVPYLASATLALLALGTLGRAANLFADHGAVRKISALPIAALAGAIAFLAYETARSAALG